MRDRVRYVFVEWPLRVYTGRPRRRASRLRTQVLEWELGMGTPLAVSVSPAKLGGMSMAEFGDRMSDFGRTLRTGMTTINEDRARSIDPATGLPWGE